VYNRGHIRMARRDQAANKKGRRPAISLARSVAAASALLLAGAAVAAPANVNRAEPGKPPANVKSVEVPKVATRAMRVIIVTDSRAGCEPTCAQWIAANGEITAETPAQFQRVFKALGQKKLPIFISSPGGSVPAALAIGREIRKRKLDVAVERTIFQKCELAAALSHVCDLRALKDGDGGRPEPIAAQCASACVFILAAGTERVVPVYGFVGVHQHHATLTMSKVLRTYQVQRRVENWRLVEQRKLIAEKQLSSTTLETHPDYAPARTYFTEMGINTAAIMPLLLGTPHHDIHRMTPDERRATRIVTRVAAGDALLPKPARPAEATLDTAEPAAASPPEADAVSKVAASLMVLYLPGGDAVDILIRVRPLDTALPTAQFTADLAFARGWTLTASSTGDGPADPLYATLANQQFCTLHRAGDLSMKVSLKSAARPGPPLQMAGDLSKAPGAAEFAEKHCSQ
jgi:hypothetical protein